MSWHHSPKKLWVEPEVDLEGQDEQVDSVPDDVQKPLGIENRSSPKFGYLARLMQVLEERRADKINTIREFMELWRKDAGLDLYPAIRLMLPEKDNRRRNYNLKESKIGKAYVLALDLAPHSAAARKLENWKVPTKEDPAAGDFGSVAYEVIQSRSSVIQMMSDVTTDDVNRILDDLSMVGRGVNPTGQKRAPGLEVARIFKQCVQTMTPIEQKWLIRIILRDLKIGLSEKTVFRTFHPNAMEYYNTCSDILRVCWKLFDRNYSLPDEDNTIKPGNVFRPMLCSRNQRGFDQIVRTMKTNGRNPNINGEDRISKSHEDEYYYTAEEFIIEEKVDGERIQVHKIGDTYTYHSRKATDYTYLYGKNAESGSLTPFMDKLFHPSIDSVVLDGEMIVYDPMIGKYLPFGNLKSYASLQTFGRDDPRPCFKVFDILYVKSKEGYEECLLKKPLKARKRVLSMAFTPQKGVIELAEMFKCHSAQCISDNMKTILEERGEGLVIKNPESRYILGGREEAWIKVKPDYMDELGETIDALVIGGYWGKGSRGGRHATFLVGLRDSNSRGSADERFLSFCRVGGGFTMEAYAQIKERTNGKWFDCDKKNKDSIPSWFHTNTEYPDQFIAPSDSFMICVKAAEIIIGAEYATGYTLRFPRCSKVRDDMDASDCMSLQDLQEMIRSGNKRSFGSDFRDTRKRTKVYKPNGKIPFISAPAGLVDKSSEMFSGTTFYISTLNHPKTSKEQLQKLVLEHGGKYVQQIPGTVESRAVIATEVKATLAAKKGFKDADIISPDWVLDSITAGRKLALTRKYYTRATEETKKSDIYQDASDAVESVPSHISALEAFEEEADTDSEPLSTELHDLRSASAEGSMSHFGREDATGAAVFADHSHDEDSPGSNSFGEDDMDEFLPEGSILQPEESPAKPSSIQEADQGVLMVKEEDENDAIAEKRLDPSGLTDARPGMGAGLGEVHYDSAKPFAYFVCYFDTMQNARKNGLPESKKSAKIQEISTKLLNKAEGLFLKCGGRVTTNIVDPKLTHIVVHKMVQDRYTQLIDKSTSGGKRHKKIVSHDWIEDTFNASDDGPLNEDEYKV